MWIQPQQMTVGGGSTQAVWTYFLVLVCHALRLAPVAARTKVKMWAEPHEARTSFPTLAANDATKAEHSSHFNPTNFQFFRQKNLSTLEKYLVAFGS